LERRGLSWAFNIHDDRPNISSRRLRPTIYVNFAGPDFVICSFVPRRFDCYDRDRLKAIPCPWGHARAYRREVF
jgi:homogentisate 1,2-dioxygenase